MHYLLWRIDLSTHIIDGKACLYYQEPSYWDLLYFESTNVVNILPNDNLFYFFLKNRYKESKKKKKNS